LFSLQNSVICVRVRRSTLRLSLWSEVSYLTPPARLDPAGWNPFPVGVYNQRSAIPYKRCSSVGSVYLPVRSWCKKLMGEHLKSSETRILWTCISRYDSISLRNCVHLKSICFDYICFFRLSLYVKYTKNLACWILFSTLSRCSVSLILNWEIFTWPGFWKTFLDY
jgi:hypothetical protein